MLRIRLILHLLLVASLALGQGNPFPISNGILMNNLNGNGKQITGLDATGSSLQPFSADLSAIAALTGTNTIYYRSGTATWTPVTIGSGLTFSGGTLASSGGGGGTPGGSDTQLQYNNSGAFGGIPTLTYDGTNPILSAGIFKFSTDTGLARTTAGVVEANNGTAGSGGIFNGTVGFRVANAAANGTVLKGNGTNFAPSTETYAAPGASGNLMTSDGTNWTSGTGLNVTDNNNPSTVSGSFATDAILPGSAFTVAAGSWKARSSYRCIFDMVKTAAGTAPFVVTVRLGTTASPSDPAILTFTFAAGTAVADTGTFAVLVNFRTVGGGTGAVVAGLATLSHVGAGVGLTTTQAPSNIAILNGVSAGFDSTSQTIISLTLNGGASFSGTTTVVQSTYMR